MTLTKVSPTESAVHAIDQLIKQLRQNRAELIASLPRRPPGRPLKHLVHPVTKEKNKIGGTA